MKSLYLLCHLAVALAIVYAVPLPEAQPGLLHPVTNKLPIVEPQIPDELPINPSRLIARLGLAQPFGFAQVATWLSGRWNILVRMRNVKTQLPHLPWYGIRVGTMRSVLRVVNDTSHFSVINLHRTAHIFRLRVMERLKAGDLVVLIRITHRTSGIVTQDSEYVVAVNERSPSYSY
ncbi:hypothetical protein BKA70DRAFT_1228912 [Coprinopsis sp. MPI-PUGE-AT-0042]|nr:hypothetical protein BKA70DRAFT_1228912 [Coprinopsis sp. MPI-PUGE-AT-0042]